MGSTRSLEEIIAREEQVAAHLGAHPIRPRPSEQLFEALSAWSAAVWAAARDAGALPVNAEAGLDLARRGVFICGVHRSGTTLVRDLLDCHPQLCVLPSEGSFLTELRRKLAPDHDWIEMLGAEWIRRLVNPTNQPPYWLLGRTASDAAPYTTFARLLMGWWPVVKERFETVTPLWPHLAVVLSYASIQFENLGAAKWWVDKTPTNERYLETLLDGLPSARVIHVVRDPIAVCASRKQLDLRTFGAFRSRWRMIVEMRRSFRTAARHAARASAELPRTAPDRSTMVARQSELVQRYCVVRYEDIVADPAATMQRLADFLEIDMDPVLLMPTAAGNPTTANSSFDQPHQAGTVRVDGADRSSTLSRPERALIRLSICRYARNSGMNLNEACF